MASGDSPAVARRRVRLAVREAREAKDFTQGQVAEAMEWSLSKVMRIETGEVTVSPNDLRPLLAHLGITDKARVDELVQDAKLSRSRQQWWDMPRYREHLTLPLRQLIQFEAEAKVIKHFTASAMPGSLQTPAYARAVLGTWKHELSGLDIEARVEARIRRRNQLLNRVEPPEVSLLLDEAVLMRKTGGVQTWRGQLSDLIDRAKEKSFAVRVISFDTDVPLPMHGSYDILYLGEDRDEDNAVMYRENYVSDEIIENSTEIRNHRANFDQLWDAALDEDASLRLIARRVDGAPPEST
jgi:transcriptional regulator with XRE-family HTH domain